MSSIFSLRWGIFVAVHCSSYEPPNVEVMVVNYTLKFSDYVCIYLVCMCMCMYVCLWCLCTCVQYVCMNICMYVCMGLKIMVIPMCEQICRLHTYTVGYNDLRCGNLFSARSLVNANHGQSDGPGRVSDGCGYVAVVCCTEVTLTQPNNFTIYF